MSKLLGQNDKISVRASIQGPLLRFDAQHGGWRRGDRPQRFSDRFSGPLEEVVNALYECYGADYTFST